MSVSFSREQAPLGTGGSIKNALATTRSETILVMNGDSFTDADLKAFCDTHRKSGAPISLLLVRVEDVSRYGGCLLNESGRIDLFSEKHSTGSGIINAGVYAINTDYFLSNTPEGPFSLEKDFLNTAPPNVFGGVVHEGCFIDIGLPSTYAACHEYLIPFRPDDKQ